MKQGRQRPDSYPRSDSRRAQVHSKDKDIQPPFWPDAAPYYSLSFVSAALLFLLVLIVFLEEPEEFRYLVPAVSAGVLFLGTVLFREVVMRKARGKFIENQRALDRNLSVNGIGDRRRIRSNRMSLEENARLVSEIKAKSKAARTLEKVGPAHLEVSRLCEAYIEKVARELPHVSSRSPRLPALHKGRREVGRLHRKHLLIWTEFETRELTRQAGDCANILERLELTSKARDTVDAALAHYPAERELTESREILDELITSIRVAEQMQQADTAKENGQVETARSHLKDALKMFTDSMLSKPDFALLADSLATEIKKIESEIEAGPVN